uniref:ribosomal protein L35 n=1 Tax=Nemalion vermiculare TaxID=935621 RepID=UPI002580C371|nr:ribosomal protein L35 [Nemalion vermiculare]WGV34472.1 ribosomal protein L35 [Nemalion vermiculare]
MPKLKTSSSISKRFKVTPTQKLLRHQGCKSHLLQKKSQSRKKRLARVVQVGRSRFKVLRQKLKFC